MKNMKLHQNQRVWSFLGWCGILSFFYFTSVGIAQTPYYGPNEPPHFNIKPPSASQLTQVQIQIYDQPDLGGLRILDVSFNGAAIPLQSPDLHGFRGGGSFQMPPGTYQLVWSVSRDKQEWPRSLKHQKSVQVQQRDTWVQVTIQGDEATIL